MGSAGFSTKELLLILLLSLTGLLLALSGFLGFLTILNLEFFEKMDDLEGVFIFFGGISDTFSTYFSRL
jgi:hypothetical protein